MHYDHEMHTGKLGCFKLVLGVKQALDSIDGGQVLRIIATDPGTAKELRAFTAQTGHELLASAESSGERLFFVRKR